MVMFDKIDYQINIEMWITLNCFRKAPSDQPTVVPAVSPGARIREGLGSILWHHPSRIGHEGKQQTGLPGTSRQGAGQWQKEGSLANVLKLHISRRIRMYTRMYTRMYIYFWALKLHSGGSSVRVMSTVTFFSALFELKKDS